MEFITHLLSGYNTYLIHAFDGNQYAVSMVTLALMGMLSYVAKGVPSLLWQQFLKHATTVLSIDSKQIGYFNIMAKLEQDGILRKSRYIALLNGRWGYSEMQLSIGAGTQYMFIFGRLTMVTTVREKLDDTIIYSIYIRSLGRSLYIANLMHEASKKPVKQVGKIRYSNVIGDDLYYSYQRHETFNKIVLSETNLIEVEKIRHFLDNEKWYIDNEIPYQLGILLHGEPGTGKTKLVRVLASMIGYEVYIVTTIDAMTKIDKNKKALIILEEADGILGDRDVKNSKEEDSALVNEAKKNVTNKALTELDGIIKAHGRIIIMTTNHPERLDKALVRPGRLDLKLNLDYVTPLEFNKFVKLYYNKDINVTEIKPKLTGAVLELSFRNGLTLDKFIKTHVIKS